MSNYRRLTIYRIYRIVFVAVIFSQSNGLDFWGDMAISYGPIFASKVFSKVISSK